MMVRSEGPRASKLPIVALLKSARSQIAEVGSAMGRASLYQMRFHSLPPGLASRLLDDEVDELSPLVEARNYSIKSRPCLRCKGNMHPSLLVEHAFSPHDPLPRMVGRCVDCGLVLDPQTNLILSTGNPAAIDDPFKIKTQED